jgi:hypothetical protein
MSILKFARVTSLPNSDNREESTVYLVKDAVNEGFFEIYATGQSTEVQKLFGRAEVNAAVADAIAGSGSLRVCSDITERDALEPDSVTLALVLDATGDSTVSTGAALYVYDNADDGAQWHKVSEYESMDVELSWDSLSGKPTSSAAAIDAAVAASHEHENLGVLNGLTVSDDDLLMYGEIVVGSNLISEEW